jgi:predicted RNA-binding Zn ribbon-like protein
MVTKPKAAPGPFSFRSQRLSCDFAATLMFRDAGQPAYELLGSPGQLSLWIQQAGILMAAPTVHASDLDQAVMLREAIYRHAVAVVTGAPGRVADRRLINFHARAVPPSTTLATNGSVTRTGTLPSALSAIARDAVDLLGGPSRARLRQCHRDGCTRLFVDRSHGANRAWCGMQQCGNRVNAAAYRRRRTPA